MDEWHEKPKESAPKDRPILCYNLFFGYYVSQWDGEDFPLGYSHPNFGQWFPVPQFWRELPSPPVSRGE